MLHYEQKRKIFQTNCVSIGIIKCFAVSTVTTRVLTLSFGIDTGVESFCHSFVYCAADDTLFAVGSEIRCSGVSNPIATVVMETTQLVLSQLKKTCRVVNGELNKVCLCQK